MQIHNKQLVSIVEKLAKKPLDKQEHFDNYETKSAPFLEHVAPKALRFKPKDGEVWIKSDLQFMLERPILSASIHGELIRLMGYDGAKAVLYEAGFKYGYEDAKNYLDYMAKSLDRSEGDFNDIFYASLGWGIWSVVELDIKSSRLHLRNWNRPDVKIFKEMYGVQENPVCFVQQGFNAGICSTIFQKKMRDIETKCIAKGDEYCELFSIPESEYGTLELQSKLKTILKGLQGVPGILASATISSDGEILASAFRADIEKETVARISATVFSVAKQTGIALRQGEFNNIFIDHAQGNIALTNIGADAVLVALSNKTVPIGSVLLRLKRTAQEIIKKKVFA